ncbi:hypothetical protein A9P82_04425 [Arachidicoccus ginsenosidimutans]|uniref:outer membrane beta-barrel protein n=1 Tax=Arachidicoccus sp. BS20 TaxID=1850526 RepID=UPI0007F04EE1|nr:outer membrane beta-barrel protein [Arachidicoccus sp. BS20]ANI88599.1 hypothetical protein A9P82_04425 [Arachidicoccus sp. BS20]
MKHILLSAIILFYASPIFSQEYIIKGVTLDSLTNQPLSSTIIILNAKDSSTIKNISADNLGNFSIYIDSSTAIILHIKCLGYKDLFVKYTPSNPYYLKDKIFLLSPSYHTLKDVTISGNTNAMEITVDKMIYLVDKDSSIKNKSGYEAVLKLPFFFQYDRNKIGYKNAQKFLVLLNGLHYKAFNDNLSNALKVIPVDLIKKIEVNTLPPEKYRSEGYAVIVNIVTNGYLKGIIGNNNVDLTYTKQNINGSYQPFLYYQKNKLGIQLNIYGSKDGTLSQIHNNIILSNNGETNIQQTNTSQNRKTKLIDGDLSLNYMFDSSLDATIYSKIGKSISNRDGKNFYSIKNDITDSTYNLFLLDKNQFTSYELGGDITKSFSKSRKLNFSFRNVRSIPNSSTNIFNQDNSFLMGSYEKDAENDLSFEISYNSPIFKKLQWETFFRYINRNYNDSYTSDSIIDNIEQTRAYKVGIGTYQQEIIWAYQGFTYRQKSFLIKLGGNIDKSLYKSTLNENNVLFTTKYNFLPSLIFRIKPSKRKNNIFYLKYNRDVRRAADKILGISVNYYDPQTIVIGNNKLTQQILNKIAVGLESSINISKTNTVSYYIEDNYNYIPDNFASYIYFDSTTSQTIYQYKNIGASKSFDIITGFNLNLKNKIFIDMYNSLSIYSLRNQIDNIVYNGNLNQLNCNIRYSILKNINISFISRYISNAPSYQGKQIYSSNYTLSISKTVIKNRGSITAYFENFLNKNIKEGTEISGIGFSRYNFTYTPALKFGISFNFRLGNLKVGEPREQKRLSNDDLKAN